MLHYPLYKSDSDSFFQAQKNLTDYCLSLLHPLKNKDVLEIGCGNGIQALHINTHYHPSSLIGIDLNEANIEIANMVKKEANIKNVHFLIDDAQNLRHIPSNSVDVLLNIESAFHYPDKPSFLKEIYRVLKPKGQFLVADILSKRIKGRGIISIWKNKMHLNHWDYNSYVKEFKRSNLMNNHFEDISNQVKKGFKLYKNWLPPIKGRNFLQNMAFKFFYYVNIRLNLYLLSTRRSYCIFVGYKPDLSFN